MKNQIMTEILNLNPWKQIILAVLGFLLLPLTLILILWYLNEKNVTSDMKKVKKAKEEKDNKIKEARKEIDDWKVEKQELIEKRTEILEKVEEMDEKASHIATDIPSANDINKLERIRRRINELK
jgi:flagellar biosynthesis/type III secretory pathway M-ring protein FliF/YscJ